MSHSSPSFLKTVIQHFQCYPKSIPNFSVKPLSRVIINRRFKKLEIRIGDAPSKSLQMRMGLEVVEEFVDVLGQSLN